MHKPTTALLSLKRSFHRIGQATIICRRVCPQGRRDRLFSTQACLLVSDTATGEESLAPRTIATWDKFRFRSGLTWLARNTAVVNPESTLSMIQAHRSEDPAQIQTMVLLVTPSLAHLLDPEVFLKPAVESIYGDLRSQTGAHELRVRSITAVVDTLPGPLPDEAHALPPISEGLAFLMSSASPLNMGEYLASTDNGDAVTLEFISSNTPDALSESKRGLVRHISLPVANTIFVNGNRTTLLQDSWAIAVSNSGATVSHQRRRPLKSFRVDVGCSTTDFLNGSVPLQPLTSPRKVVRSMGNVLAQIEVDGASVPASRELEKAVTEYTKSDPARASRGPFQVFALVRPPGTLYTEGPEVSKNDVLAQRVLPELWQDAKLYKVTGGGGGWGKKQGLLSLDTAVDFGMEETTVGFPDLETTENLSHEIGSHGMIPRDGTVQFLLYSGEQASQPLPENSSLQAQDHAQPAQRQATSIIIGTTSNPDTQELQGSVQREGGPGVSFYPNHFGMISYGGAALGSDENPIPDGSKAGSGSPTSHVSRTRLDVPDSVFVLRTLPGASSRASTESK